MHTGLLVILCIMLMGMWPQIAQAELSDDPLPLSAADCEKENGEWEKVMCGVKNIVGFAQKISKVYSGFSGTFNAAEFLGRILGILDKEVNLKNELDKLHRHLDKLGAALDKRSVKLHQADQLGLNLHMVEVAAQNTDLGMPFNQNTDGVNVAGGYIKAAMQPLYFERYFVESATDGETQGAWKKVISGATPDSDGFVYDWRVGVPHLMQLIALRLAILPIIDQNFNKDWVFKEELIGYWQTLHEHYVKMIKGVDCNYILYYADPLWVLHGDTWLTIDVACADIYTGLAAINQFETTAYSFFEPHDDWHSKLSRNQQELRSQVLLKLPLFEMQSMMDLLSLYGYGAYDLSEKMPEGQAIALLNWPNLCLDVQWGNPASGTPVWIWDCNGGNAQKWIYERQSGRIRNPVFNKCLEIQSDNPAPGTSARISDCNGDNAQKWTYDPAWGVLQNALGTVLQIDVPVQAFCEVYVNGSCSTHQYSLDYSSVKAGTPVMTGVRDEGVPEQWWEPFSVVRPPVRKLSAP
jgi:hypothetical protein